MYSGGVKVDLLLFCKHHMWIGLEEAPIYLFISRTLMYGCTYVCMYACMYVCTDLITITVLQGGGA